jgi:hypothetical protein
VSQHALCDHCATLKKLTSTGLIVRHYLTFDVSRRAIHSLGKGRIRRLCQGSGKPPRPTPGGTA